MQKKYSIKAFSPKNVQGIGENIFEHMVDISLWTAVYLAELTLPQSRSGYVFRSTLAADTFLSQWNYQTIKRAIVTARQKGFLKPSTRGRRALPQITEAGKKRLASILPVYDHKRAWDKRLHIITYDIPETKRADRDILRETLRHIGCGLLQESVWITPYNPIDTLRETIRTHDLAGNIIISDMGTDGSIGEENLQELIVRIYQLEKINDRYKMWIGDAKRKKIRQWELIQYLSILKDDPQLPFSLLPGWWKGSQAYRLIKPKLKELHFQLRPHSKM